MPSQVSEDEFVRRMEEKHPCKIDHSKTIYRTMTSIARLTCLCGTSYERKPNRMFRQGANHGCPSCCPNGLQDTKESFIQKATAMYSDKYKYDQVNYVNSMTPVKIGCPKGHIFDRLPNKFLQGDGCGECSGHGRTFAEFRRLSDEKYGKDVFKFNEKNYNGMTSPLEMICPRGHVFTINAHTHLVEKSKGGCMKCSNIESGIRKSYTQEECIDRFKKSHGERYDYSLVNYVDSLTPVTIICKIHGEFQQVPVSHIQGFGCKECGFKQLAQTKTRSDQQWIDKAHIVHGDKYTYLRVFREIDLKNRPFFQIRCPNGHIFTQRCEHHLQGNGCGSCSNRFSKPQIEWLNYIAVEEDIRYGESGEFKPPGTTIFVDGYSSETNTIFEFQGDFWHGNPKSFDQSLINPRTRCTYGELFAKTLSRKSKLESLGYRVIEMWEYDWNKGKLAVQKIQHAFKKRLSLNTPQIHSLHL